MRIRTLACRVLATAALVVAGTAVTAAPASAGAPYSDWCSDGVGYLEVPILTSPVTVAAEVNRSPLDPTTQQLQLCYSTTAVGTPGGVIGGNILIRTDRSVNPLWVTVGVYCNPDAGISVGPITCAIPNGVYVFPVVLPTVTTPATTTCLVTVGGVCQLFLPGVKIYTGSVGALLVVDGIPLGVGPTANQCIAFITTCP